MTIRYALISYDWEHVEKLNYQAEASCLGWVVGHGLVGQDYAAERGILDITIIPDQAIAFVPIGVEGIRRVS